MGGAAAAIIRGLSPRPPHPVRSKQPLRVFLLVLLLVFAVEAIIMLVLPSLERGPRNARLEAGADAVALTALLAPALWLVVVRPIQRLYASRGELLGQLFSAQEDERARLARDLHDELGQHLTAIQVGLRTIDQARDLEQARERARTLAESGAAGLDKLRRIARGLRPAALEDLGLGPAVERLCEEHRAAHATPVALSIDLGTGDRPTPEAEMCLFRVLQESLTNAARHAHATSIRVDLRRRPGGISLEIEDNGSGFDAAECVGRSFGLLGMRERVELLGGRFSLRSARGQGTTISVFLPEHTA